MTIGDRIKTARSNAGLTQRALAEKSGIATGTVQQYELGKRQPRIEQLQKIADALEVDINYLVHGKTLQKYEQAMIEELRLAAEANKTGDDSKLKAFIAQNLPHVTVKAGWESVSTDQNRTRMNAAFDQLNPEGQAVAADQVENLTYNPKYQKKESE